MNRQEWLEARRTGLGGSDLAALMGWSSYATIVDVWEEKTGAVEVSDDDQTPLQEIGQLLEPVILRKYVEWTGKKTRRVDMKRDSKEPWRVASFDSLSLKSDSDPLGIVDAKSMGFSIFRKMRRDGLSKAIAAQGYWYNGFGYPYCDFACLCRETGEFEVVRVEEDAGIQAELIERGREFWFHNVVGGVRPELPDTDDAVKMPALGADDNLIHVKNVPGLGLAVLDLGEAFRVRKDANEGYAAAKEAFVAAVEEDGTDCTIFEYDDLVRVYSRMVPGRLSWDPPKLKQFIEAHGASVENLKKQGKDFPELRTYVLKGANEDE